MSSAMQADPAPIRHDLDEARFRQLAGARLHQAAPETLFDPKTGRVLGPSDFDLNPDLANFLATAPPPREAAVLVPVIRRDPLTVLFTRRTETLNAHAGQISFPGGVIDRSDEDAIATALRETEEEIGLARRFAEPLGLLDTYRTGTGFRIQPVVALIAPTVTLTLNNHEVAETFEVPLAFLMDPANHQRHVREFAGRERHFYAMPYGPHYIWGATAGILKNMQERFFGP